MKHTIFAVSAIAALTVTLTAASAPAHFPHPTSIAIDGAGNLYVGDTASNTIQKISTANVVTPVAGLLAKAGFADGSGTTARFNHPNGLASAADGTLSVSDGANATLRHVSAAGVVSTLAGAPAQRGNLDGIGSAATFASPYGLSVDSSGTLLVADALNHTIRKVTGAGAVSTFAGRAGVVGIADGSGTQARFDLPTGLVIDGSGNCYVADTNNNTIRKITSAGKVTTLAGLAGVTGFANGTGSTALFDHPGGLAVDKTGNVYVADTRNSLIRKITPAGVVTTLAGLPGISGLQDGSGSGAFFNQPEALVLDTAGNIYVADTGNGSIRKITAAGVVTTLVLP